MEIIVSISSYELFGCSYLLVSVQDNNGAATLVGVMNKLKECSKSRYPGLFTGLWLKDNSFYNS